MKMWRVVHSTNHRVTTSSWQGSPHICNGCVAATVQPSCTVQAVGMMFAQVKGQLPLAKTLQARCACSLHNRGHNIAKSGWASCKTFMHVCSCSSGRLSGTLCSIVQNLAASWHDAHGQLGDNSPSLPYRFRPRQFLGHARHAREHGRVLAEVHGNLQRCAVDLTAQSVSWFPALWWCAFWRWKSCVAGCRH